MLSYKGILDINDEELATEMGLNAECTEYLSEILSSFRSLTEEGVGVGVCHSEGCLNVRIIDGDGCMFVFPIPLYEEADAIASAVQVGEYSRRELVPLTFTDVPREYIGELGRVFSKLNASVYEDDEDCFFVAVESECAALDEVPSISYEGVTLDEITDEDRSEYARLCSDRELNRWWGYDASVDNPQGNEDYYLAVARGEFRAGVAITLAVRNEGRFVGEAVIYDFDYSGGAAIGIRILKEWQGKGIGSRTLSALIELCKRIGLRSLRTSIMEQNEASVKMTRSRMTEIGRQDGRVDFALDI